MILVVDVFNAGWRIGAVGETAKGGGGGMRLTSIWLRGDAVRSAAAALAVARKKKTHSGRPTCIVVAVNAPGAVRDVSWSMIRSSVAAVNSMAFALKVPVCGVAVLGSETDDELAAAALVAARGAKLGTWVGPEYSGEPTITVGRR
ncbi:MAG: hypothetical protein RLZZ324_839 [Candidatus Parcubacteria bacterium]